MAKLISNRFLVLLACHPCLRAGRLTDEGRGGCLPASPGGGGGDAVLGGGEDGQVVHADLVPQGKGAG